MPSPLAPTGAETTLAPAGAFEAGVNGGAVVNGLAIVGVVALTYFALRGLFKNS